MARSGRVCIVGRLLTLALACLAIGSSGAEERLPATVAGPAAPAPARRVLVLHSERAALPSVAEIDRAIGATLMAPGNVSVDLFSEYLDVGRFPDGRFVERYGESLHYRYAETVPDVLIAVGGPAVDFLVRRGAAVFPGVPVVVCSLEARHLRGRPLPANFTGVTMAIQTRSTLDLAMRLHPGTRRLVIVAGVSSLDRYWARETSRVAREAAPALEVVDLGALAMPAMLAAVASQPAHTVIFYTHVLRDAAGQHFTPAEALGPISRAANAPVYGAYDTYVGRGIVGGDVLLFERQGAEAARIALRVLGGEHPEQIPIDRGASSGYRFDGRELRRWRIREGLLPAGSEVRFREPTAWQSYRWYIVGGCGLLAVQGAFIAGLLVQRSRRRRAERALAERLRFEALLSDLSARFTTAPAGAVDREIEHALRRIGDELDLDRATMVELAGAPGAVRVSASWERGGTEPVPRLVTWAKLPWIRARVIEREIVRFARPEALPAEAATDLPALHAMGTRSLAVIPLSLEGAVVGAVAFSTVRSERAWPDDLLLRLRLLEQIFAHALARRRADRALRESEERFALMADSAPVMVWLAGPDGRRTYLNARWLAFTGRRLEDELGEGWLASVHPDNREACRGVLAAALADRSPITIEYRLRDRDRMWRWVVDHAVPRIGPDGTFAGYVGTCIDVSELRAAEQAAVNADALRSAIFGALDGHVVALDRHGVVIAVNRSWMDFARANGADPERVGVGADYLAVCRAAAGMGDADGRRALAVITAALDGSGAASRLEYSCASPAGERWYELSVEPLRRPEGGALVSHLDITRRRHAEEAARLGAEDLAHVQRVGTLGDLAAALAHEINQPLTAIVANAQATLRLLDRAGEAPADAVAALLDIADDGKRAAEVIRRLRALFRKDHAVRELVPVNELVDEVVRLLDAELQRKGVAMVVDGDPALPPVLGDPVQLQQVLLNVLVNAAEAVAAAEAGPREIRIATRFRAPELVEVTVADTGVGVKGDPEHIFARFYTSKPDGLGMGLPISRSIVQAHGGRIWAVGNEGRGITVHVELPCHEPGPSR